METITFNYKTKVEQFKEQFPELYQAIYDLGYTDGQADSHYREDGNINYDEEPWQPEYAKPEDNSKRFAIMDYWEIIYNKALYLEAEGYIAGNRDWKQFMATYNKDWAYKMYIAWNPTHKQFAVESNMGTINELYPHLVNAKEFNNELSV